MNNQIAKKFDTLSLLKFTLPSMIMMLFMALYQMVDAVFVSNFVSETALSALNIVYPLISFIIAVAVMEEVLSLPKRWERENMPLPVSYSRWWC